MTFGQTLASFRRRERLSQLELAERSGVSQRHISFLESGRSNPGSVSVTKLVRAMDLPYAAANELYSSAGLACPHRVLDFDDPAFVPARRALEHLIAAHDPYPAVATFRNGDIVSANTAFEAALGVAFGGEAPWRQSGVSRDNLYELTLHPDGLRHFMCNPAEIIPHTLRRLRHASYVEEAAMETLLEVGRYPGMDRYTDLPEPNGVRDTSVLIERYEIGGTMLSLISIVASFGSPEDVTAQALQFELFYPDDAQTRDFFLGLAAAPGD